MWYWQLLVKSEIPFKVISRQTYIFFGKSAYTLARVDMPQGMHQQFEAPSTWIATLCNSDSFHLSSREEISWHFTWHDPIEKHRDHISQCLRLITRQESFEVTHSFWFFAKFSWCLVLQYLSKLFLQGILARCICCRFPMSQAMFTNIC